MILNEYQHRFEKIRVNIVIFAGTSQSVTVANLTSSRISLPSRCKRVKVKEKLLILVWFANPSERELLSSRPQNTIWYTFTRKSPIICTMFGNNASSHRDSPATLVSLVIVTTPICGHAIWLSRRDCFIEMDSFIYPLTQDQKPEYRWVGPICCRGLPRCCRSLASRLVTWPGR
jgi:hypothetical protein